MCIKVSLTNLLYLILFIQILIQIVVKAANLERPKSLVTSHCLGFDPSSSHMCDKPSSACGWSVGFFSGISRFCPNQRQTRLKMSEIILTSRKTQTKNYINNSGSLILTHTCSINGSNRSPYSFRSSCDFLFDSFCKDCSLL